MPAVSEAQRGFMGAVRAYKEGRGKGSPAVRRAARSMSIEQTRDFTKKSGRSSKRSKRRSRR